MTLQDEERLRTPGPLGGDPSAPPGSPMPGPLGFRNVLVAAPKAAKSAFKTFKMPGPASGNESRNAHALTGQLFDKAPQMTDVQQGFLANCPLAAILAALASKPAGRNRITAMIVEKSAAVVTDLADVADKLASPPANNAIQSQRYFVVTIGNSAVEVSDVFYTTDHDRGYEAIYMRSPNGVLWPLVIEAAFAVKLGGYNNVDALNANDTWKMVMGTPPTTGIKVDKDTALDRIREMAAEGARVPMIGASRDSDTQHVSSFHGFAMLGTKKAQIEMYDPAAARTIKLTDKQFREDFQAILA